MTPSIDISIVTYNSEMHLEKLFESLNVQQGVDLHSVSLFFYDNNSHDHTILKLTDLAQDHKSKFHKIIVKENKRNLGFGTAQNAIIQDGEGDFIFILNPDVELDQKALATLAEKALASSIETAAWEARQVPYEHPKIYNPVTMETSWASGAALFVRRTAFEKVKGFDTDIFLYGEDVDLSWRLREQGLKIKYVPDALVWHYTYQSKNEIKPDAYIGSTRTNLMLRTRYGTWKDILEGLKMQLGILLLQNRQVVANQRFEVFKTLLKFFRNAAKWRKSSHRKKSFLFYGWDYEQTRYGAFYDTGQGIKTLGRYQFPKVSVLMRTMGRASLVRQGIRSVVNQTYKNIELILIEDGPATLDGIQNEFPDLLIRYHAMGKNQGRCIAGNDALARATGEYFLFLDEDDLLYADHVEQLLATCLEKKVKVAYGYTFEIPSIINKKTDEIEKEGTYCQRFNRHFSFMHFVMHNFLPINSVLFHKSLYEKCGGFDPDLEYMEDWHLWVRFSLLSRPFIDVKKTTALYRVPMTSGVTKERREKLLYYRDLARAKLSRLPLNVQLSDLQELSDGYAAAESMNAEKALRNYTPRQLHKLVDYLIKWYRLKRGIY